MPIKPYLTSYEGANPIQDADPITGSMPDLDNETALDAGDGDEARSSQITTPRNKLQAVCKMAGDSVNAPVGSLAEILDRDHANGDARWVRLRERAAAPTQVADKAIIYALDDGGVTKFYVIWSDGTIVSVGTPVDGAVTNAKLADMAQATIKGRASGAGTGVPVDLTSAQATAILDAFTDALQGVVPASGGGTTNFLRADGSWAAPGGASPLTTKGDLYTFTTVDARLPVGGTDGHVLTVDAAEAAGIKWAAAPGGGGFTAYEEEFTAVAGANEFTLSATPAVNANTLSGRNILGVFRNGVRSRYQATVTLANEYNQSGGTDRINVTGQSGGELFTVVFGV